MPGCARKASSAVIAPATRSSFDWVVQSPVDSPVPGLSHENEAIPRCANATQCGGQCPYPSRVAGSEPAIITTAPPDAVLALVGGEGFLGGDLRRSGKG